MPDTIFQESIIVLVLRRSELQDYHLSCGDEGCCAGVLGCAKDACAHP